MKGGGRMNLTEEQCQRVIEMMEEECKFRLIRIERAKESAGNDLVHFVKHDAPTFMIDSAFIDTWQLASPTGDYTAEQIVNRLQRIIARTIGQYTLRPPQSTSIMKNLSTQWDAQAAAQIQEIIEDAVMDRVR